jgi:hypothetical protein
VSMQIQVELASDRYMFESQVVQVVFLPLHF